MDTTQLSVWRDAALTFLALEAIVLILLPGLALYKIVPAIRPLTMRLQRWLLQSRLVVMQIQRATQRAMGGIAAPFVWLRSAVEGTHEALRRLGWR
ncbi:MAG: hypothetical protein H5T68_00495 [Chloroflexi bacterium]|nr:hypothetical protein [Chloroflexota bacterium]